MADSTERPVLRYVAVLATGCGLLAAACTSGRHTPVPPPSGCDATRIRVGAAPHWAATANPPHIPYALAARGRAAGFLFGNPLRAGDPAHKANKILWIVASPRDGKPLRLSAHPVGATAPVVTSTWPANSEPGEIYPSIINVPAPGCWHFTLSWNGHSDTVDLRYISPG